MTRDDVVKAMAEAKYEAWRRRVSSELPWKECHELTQAEMIDDLRHALSALESLGIALVPVEATDEMRVRGAQAVKKAIGVWGEPNIVYNAMLASSPLRKTEGGEE